ncbi:flavin-containing monooxygenase [Modestobacter versicolor]|uniref:flavin-containing monooxygenase n=1 Tax=Modestobacter versicolor TaxID=429133 RepID=UPI0034DFAB39
MSHPSEILSAPRFDAVVVGAGFTGVYALERLVSMGLSVKLIEAGSGVGGTWHWNRYPGARFDSESYSYGYYHDQELLDSWDWSEKYAGAPEIERYLNHAVDHWGLREHIQLDTKVVGAVYNEATKEWDISLSTGEEVRCKYFVPAVGLLSATYTPPFPNMESFEGQLHHTSRWPHEPVDFTGKKVAVIGTAASGVQIIPKIAEVAETLTVFQRTPNWATPLNNHPLTKEDMASIRANFEEIRAKIDKTWMAFPHEGPDPRNTFDVSEEERLKKYEQLYRQGGLSKVSDNFADMARNPEANAAWSGFIADKIRERVKDPVVAEKLIPKDHGFGAKRPPQETNYYEAYNRDNVALVDLHETPIVTFTPAGIETTALDFDFDIIVLATGFDAVTGAQLNLNIRGVDGLELRDAWGEGPITLFGALVPGFPNLFITGGPHVGVGNVPRATEHQVNFIIAAIAKAEAEGATTVAVTDEAARAFVDHVLDAVAALGGNLNYKNNWYTGGNIPGKVRVFSQYSEGVPEYRRRMEEDAAKGFPGVVFA